MTENNNFFKCCKVTFIANFDKDEQSYFGEKIMRNCELKIEGNVALFYNSDNEIQGAFSLETCFIDKYYD